MASYIHNPLFDNFCGFIYFKMIFEVVHIFKKFWKFNKYNTIQFGFFAFKLLVCKLHMGSSAMARSNLLINFRIFYSFFWLNRRLNRNNMDSAIYWFKKCQSKHADKTNFNFFNLKTTFSELPAMARHSWLYNFLLLLKFFI